MMTSLKKTISPRIVGKLREKVLELEAKMFKDKQKLEELEVKYKKWNKLVRVITGALIVLNLNV